MNFFNVTVVQEKESFYLDSKGFHIPVPGPKQKKLKSFIGEKIVLGIRPEDIHAPEYVPAGILASAVQASVDVIEIMGSEIYLHLITEGESFLARVDPRSKARPGQRTEVIFDMANMHAFDSKSGQVL